MMHVLALYQLTFFMLLIFTDDGTPDRTDPVFSYIFRVPFYFYWIFAIQMIPFSLKVDQSTYLSINCEHSKVLKRTLEGRYVHTCMCLNILPVFQCT